MNGRIGSRQNKVGVEQTVEQIYAKKRWGSSKRQNSIKFKTKKDEGSMNGRIRWKQKKMKVDRTVEQSYDKKRQGLSERQNRVMTKKDGI